MDDLFTLCYILVYIAHLHELKLKAKPIQDKVGISSPFLNPKNHLPTYTTQALIKIDRRWPLGTLGLIKRLTEGGTYMNHTLVKLMSKVGD